MSERLSGGAGFDYTAGESALKSACKAGFKPRQIAAESLPIHSKLLRPQRCSAAGKEGSAERRTSSGPARNAGAVPGTAAIRDAVRDARSIRDVTILPPPPSTRQLAEAAAAAAASTRRDCRPVGLHAACGRCSSHELGQPAQSSVSAGTGLSGAELERLAQIGPRQQTDRSAASPICWLSEIGLFIVCAGRFCPVHR